MIQDVGEAQEAAEEFISLLCVEVNIYSFSDHRSYRITCFVQAHILAFDRHTVLFSMLHLETLSLLRRFCSCICIRSYNVIPHLIRLSLILSDC